MNKIKLYTLLLFTSIGIQTIKPSSNNLSKVIPILQTINSSLYPLENLNTSSSNDINLDNYVELMNSFLSLFFDIYNQTTSSNSAAEENFESGLWNALSLSLNANETKLQTDFINFYQSAQGVSTVTTITPQDIQNGLNTTVGYNAKSALGIPEDKIHNVINQKPFISPSAYTTQTLQYLSIVLIDLANIAAKFSETMAQSITNDAVDIANNTTIDPSANPLNANILKLQVIQDFCFITNISLVYLANTITQTLNTATVLYNPHTSCSDTMANSIFAAILSTDQTSELSLFTNLLDGNVSATLPTQPTTITITQNVIYAAICAFTNEYDANSINGPYQAQIQDIISINNAIQML